MMEGESIFDKYDLNDVNESVAIPDRPNDGLTVIVGASGSGKTTILKAWGLQPIIADVNTPVYKLFESEELAEKKLISAGLRTIPAWKRPLSHLSNGERHRAEIALMLCDDRPIIDEFTSLVDRDTARALCVTLNKQKLNGAVLATCHRDVLNWLDADYIYDVDLATWVDRGFLRQGQKLTLDVIPCDTKKAWQLFGKHHYLSSKVNSAAVSYCAYIGEKPVAMVSAIAFPSGSIKNAYRGHRTVVLPEFQGMGIGSALSDFIAGEFVKNGARFFSKTAHPAFGRHRENSPNWKGTSKNKKNRSDYSSGRKTKEYGHKMKHAHRVCFSHEFIGAE